MKYLGIDLTKYEQDLAEEKYKNVMKEIKDRSKQKERYSMIMDRKTQYC